MVGKEKIMCIQDYEKIIKRYLKKKIGFSLAIMISFLVTGEIIYGSGEYKNKEKKISVPWFIFFFVLAMLFNTYVLGETETGQMIGNGMNDFARKMLTITLFFIGASLSRDVLKAVGIKPLVQGILLWVVISLSTLAYIYCF